MVPKFSIIMPNYNSNYLKRAIETVTNQEYKHWELIIIDNYSDNHPENTVKQFNNNNICIYKYKNRNNIARARNFGIKKSKYEWIAFLDSDDVWSKDKLLRISKVIINNDVDFIYHGMFYLPKKFGFIRKIIKDKSKEVNKPIYNSLIINGNGIANSSAVMRKKLLLEINLISENEEKFSWEDYDCWIRFSQVTDKFYFINKILGSCWIGEGRISNLDQTYINFKNFHKVYKNEILKLTNKKRLDWYYKFLIIWYFKKKLFYRSFILIKKTKLNSLNYFIWGLLIKFFFYKKVFFKKLKL